MEPEGVERTKVGRKGGLLFLPRAETADVRCLAGNVWELIFFNTKELAKDRD
jgi:hypothetical protein